MSNLRNLVLDLIEQIEMTDFADQGGYLKNNAAYQNLKTALEAAIHVNEEQSFKSGINDLVKVAVRDNQPTVLKNCQTKINGEFIKFEVEVRIVEKIADAEG
ncbi:hypothetical protein QSV37_04960 [Acinetobacter sp. VNK23]|uniref:hypothetical protein n=1 Tax=Acinetobacter thutiue TaxID=2998078 RepID=UPI002577F323|nr:hypothetical protein [Acinetobacter thutiue]MDM1019661.1 hypothetical protein [Acinetobacter thutiue]